MKMLIKHLTDQFIINSPTCGEIREILTKKDDYNVGIAIAIDIQPTQAHFHLTFDEIYFVLDGHIKLKVYDPSNEKIHIFDLTSNELCVISKGLHHQIIEASKNNRLCVISYPVFHADDEHPSAKI
jgi:mannose-6-phosphate isomerase-like protein (cupin superfamily)